MTRRLLACGVLLELCFAGMLALGDLHARAGAFLLLYGAAFAVYLIAWRATGSDPQAGCDLPGAIPKSVRDPPAGDPRTAAPALLAIGFAVVFRLTLLAAPPSLSGDVHRYVWDGVVLGSGENPYRHAPADPERARFAALALRVNHAEVPTVYPPLAEAVFVLATAIVPSERAVRVALTLGEVLVWAGYARLLARAGKPAAGVIAVAWCPLIVLETAGSGHLDALALGLLLLGVALLLEGSKGAATWLLFASASVKYLALAVTLAVARRLGAWRVIAVFGLSGLAFLPFVRAGTRPWRGLVVYAERWQFNAPLFTPLVATLERLDTTRALKGLIAGAQAAAGDPAWMTRLYYHVYPQEVARGMIGIAYLALVIAVAVRDLEPVRAAGIAVFGFLLLTPTLHPWYAIWGVPFAAARGSRAFLWLAAAVPLAYHPRLLAARSDAAAPALYLLEFVPFFLLLGLDLRRSRRTPLPPAPSPAPARTPGRRSPGRRLSRERGPGVLPRRNILGPPSPFARPAWQRFREDTVPAWKAGFMSFWRSRWRLPVLALAIGGGAWIVHFTLRPYPALSGQVVRHETPVVGAEVEILWYATRQDVQLSKSRPYQTSDRESVDADVAVEERALARGRVTTGADGRFGFAGGRGLVWPGMSGPFLRLRIHAKDPLSGAPYRVRRFALGNGSEVIGALDSARDVGDQDLGLALSRIALAANGRIEAIATEGDLIATAEGQAGVRLYRLEPSAAPVLIGHRFPPEGDIARGVAFAGTRLVVLRNRGYDLVQATPELKVEATLDQRVDSCVAASADRMALLYDGDLNLVKPVVPLPAVDRVFLGDAGRARAPEGFEYVAVRGSLLFYLHSDGTLRLSDLDSSFRTPATLTDPGGAVIAWDYLPAREKRGAMVVLASRTGASAYDVARSEATHRLGHVDLENQPLAVHGRAVVGAKGVALLTLAGESLAVDRVVPLECDEVEAKSSWIARNGAVLPELDDIQFLERRTDPAYDPVRNQTLEKLERLRDSARLTAVRILDLETGDLVRIQLPDPPRVLLRTSGRNQSLLAAPLADGRLVVARPDGTLLVLDLAREGAGEPAQPAGRGGLLSPEPVDQNKTGDGAPAEESRR